jgi:hypothetical protein
MRSKSPRLWFPSLCVLSLFYSSFASTELKAEGRPFIISSTSLGSAPPSDPGVPEPAPNEGIIIERLKQMVVADYLRQALGARFQEYAQKLTTEFSEDYILDYKVSRKENTATPGATPLLELTGHLDVDGLNRWVRLNETKARGSASLRPVFVISSEAPGLNYSPGNSAATSKTTSLGQIFYSELGRVFKKFNTDLGLVADRSLLLAVPPESSSQIAELRDYAGTGGNNSVAWVHLQPCRTPGCGLRAEIHTYNLSQNRRLFVQSAPIKIGISEFGDTAKLQSAIEPLIQDYARRFEESVSKGTLFSTSYRLIVRNVDQYRGYKKLKTALSKLEYLVQAVPKRIRANESEFQVLSPLSSRELAQRLQITSFPGFKLAATSADANQIEVRMVVTGSN